MSNHRNDLLVIGVGASAGGLAALKSFFRPITKSGQFVFIIVQHLDPNHKSLLNELLSRECQLDFREVKQGMQLQADTVYTISPNTAIEIEGYELKTTALGQQHGIRRTIDHLFESLAVSHPGRCAGVILSGSGSDGTDGLRKVKAADGLTLAQDPDTAEHASMPMHAIDAGAVDKVLRPEEMFAALKVFHSQAGNTELFNTGGDDERRAALSEIGAILKSNEDFELNQYKLPTIHRRIARRMSLIGISSLSEYAQKLRESNEERAQLTKDLLVNVTHFFRDREAFELLESEVVPEIIKRTGSDEEIRIWVAGCASGEEVYSLTIVFLEVLERLQRHNSLKIFATDIDGSAIATARRGIYPASVTVDIPENYLHKYFTENQNDNSYKIKSHVREAISFAVQNMANDPPFGNMHLISCRNVLIYFTKSVQERILSSFYFSLRNDGFLFLGTSESLGSKGDGFEVLSKKWRLYKKIKGFESNRLFVNNLKSQNRQNELNRQALGAVRPNLTGRSRDATTRTHQMRRSLLETFLPPAAIVDYEGKILFIHGDWKPFMAIRSAEPTHNLVQLLVPELRSRMRSALYKVTRTGESVEFTSNIHDEEAETTARVVKVEICPISNTEFSDQRVFGVVLHYQSRTQVTQELTNDDDDRAKRDIEQELMETREELQNTVEELETSSEELKASHEEALSTNEELQSANEELEASSEELRSLNEELSTLNVQLKEKIELLQKANDDVENFFASTDVPTIFLDPQLNIQRYTPAAEQLLKMGPRDVGRSISSLGRDLVDADLEEDCHKVLANFQPVRSETQTAQGNWYIRQVTPYRTEERRVDGVVIVFQDITAIKKLSHRALSREKQQAVVAKLGIYALSGSEPDDLIQQAVREVTHTLNADYCKILRYRPETGDFLLIAGTGWKDGAVGNLIVPGGQDSQAGYTLISQGPVVVPDLRVEKRFSGPKLLREHNVISGISCLINHDEPPFGVIGVHSTKQRNFSEDDSNFLVSVANLLSTALRMKASQDAILEQERQFRSLANSIPQLAWMTDETGYIYWYNQRWYDYTGTDFESVKGWGWQSVHHPDHIDRVVANFKRSLDAAEVWEDEFPLRSKSGEYRWFLSRAMPIVNQESKVVGWFGTNTDVTEKLEQATALRASEQKLRLAMETNKIGSFEYYLREEVTYWDPMLSRIWGLEKGQMPTQELFWRGVHPEDASLVEQAITKALNPQLSGRYHCVYRVVNLQTEEVTWVEASGQVIFQDGNPDKMIGMVIDISERKELEDTLRLAVKELQIADQSKNEFLSILGHELRNPLAALSNSIEIIADQGRDDSELFRVMKHSVSTMARLLDDLLDLNRVSRNKIEIAVKSVDLANLLRNVADIARGLCSKKQQHLTIEVDENLYVEADSQRVEQIFTNIVFNASRYTPYGGLIEIKASREHGWAVIRVKDNGVGIEAELLEKVFDPFFQIKQHEQAASGLGIGLALSKKLVSLHGGKISAHSNGLNRGTEFTVWLPLSNTPSTIENPTSKLNRDIKEGLKVLVVEDNENILATVPVLLESLGCEVEIAESGLESLRKLEAFKPEAMLVDIGLPDISGHEVAERARACGYSGLLVAISGYSHKEVRETSKTVGFDEHLAKPVSMAELTEVLSRVENIEAKSSG